MRITEGQLRRIVREELNEASARKPWYDALFNDIAAGRMGMFSPATENSAAAWLAANPGTQDMIRANRARDAKKNGEKIPHAASDAQWLRREYARWYTLREMTRAVNEGTLDPYTLDSIIMWLQDRKDLTSLLQSSGIVGRGEDLPSLAGVLSDAWRARRR